MLSELRNLPAPAKLNLFLHVTGRRADGYHLLETVFQFIDLHDRLDLRLREDGAVNRADAPAGIPQDLDLTLRAANALKAATGCRLGVDIGLRKFIPIGAGLGGGSSDAATVLIGLNRLWRLGLGRSELIEVARPLGADVPVFVYGRNAYATGIGDRFRPIGLPRALVRAGHAAGIGGDAGGIRRPQIDTKHQTHHNVGLFQAHASTGWAQ